MTSEEEPASKKDEVFDPFLRLNYMATSEPFQANEEGVHSELARKMAFLERVDWESAECPFDEYSLVWW